MTDRQTVSQSDKQRDRRQAGDVRLSDTRLNVKSFGVFQSIATTAASTPKSFIKAKAPITFTVRPKNNKVAWKGKNAKEVFAVPMSRENPEVYSIVERAHGFPAAINGSAAGSATGSAIPSVSTIESNKTITSTNGTHPFVVAIISKTAVLTGLLAVDQDDRQTLKTAPVNVVQRDEEPPATPLLLDLAAERALLLPGKGVELAAGNGTDKETVFAEFKPRQLFQ